MKIYHVLEKVENAVYNSRKLPLFPSYSLIKRDKILNLIEKTRNNLPEEMKRARWVSKENQRIIQEAQVKAGEIVREAEVRSKELMREAKEESRRILDKEAIVVNAKDRAEEILSGTKTEAERLLNEARGKSNNMVKKAEMTATDITYRANTESKRVRKSADEYSLKILTGMEKEIFKIHGILKNNLKQIKTYQTEEMERKTSIIEQPSLKKERK
ncbi:MAG: hypothetical protein K8T10_20825 [Candidatus Eremiobacteraeota bacterium]|nr:hypothetical protein [Candidatus Eremiobacteraeota bacterium]